MELLRTDDPAVARQQLAERGACVLCGLRPEAESTVEASLAIWGRDDLLSAPPVAEVSMAVNQPPHEPTGVPTWYSGVSREPPHPTERYDGSPGKTPPRAHSELLEPHSDGYAYGDAYPDAIVLLCAQDCEEGGETFIVDGYGVLETLESSPEHSWVVDALASREVCQGEAGRRSSVSSVAQRAPSGRTMLRNMLWVQRPNEENSPEEQRLDAEMLDAWHSAVMAAPRSHVKLAPGEALVIDNYRCFHGRTPFGKGAEGRQLWRQWVWTTDAKAVPVHDGEAGANTSNPWTITPEDAEEHAAKL
jgi:alpha-ketoglutarate-dependent taurine dioxygenase